MRVFTCIPDGAVRVIHTGGRSDGRRIRPAGWSLEMPVVDHNSHFRAYGKLLPQGQFWRKSLSCSQSASNIRDLAKGFQLMCFILCSQLSFQLVSEVLVCHVLSKPTPICNRDKSVFANMSDLFKTFLGHFSI